VLVGAQHDAVGADVVAETGHAPGGVDVVRTADSEVDAAFLVGDEIVEASEWFAVEAVSQDSSFGRQHADPSWLGALRRLLSGVGARALDGKHAAFGVDRDRAGAMRVLEGDRDLVVRIELADAIRLFLREQQSAIVSADDAIGVVGPLPGQHPPAVWGNDARNWGDDNRARALWLSTPLGGKRCSDCHQRSGKEAGPDKHDARLSLRAA
jgi:hypothetical protein